MYGRPGGQEFKRWLTLDVDEELYAALTRTASAELIVQRSTPPAEVAQKPEEGLVRFGATRPRAKFAGIIPPEPRMAWKAYGSLVVAGAESYPPIVAIDVHTW